MNTPTLQPKGIEQDLVVVYVIVGIDMRSHKLGVVSIAYLDLRPRYFITLN